LSSRGTAQTHTHPLREFRSEERRAAALASALPWRNGPDTRLEIRLGRLMAVCLQPGSAWRLLSMSERLLVAATYAAAAYLVTLGALLILQAV
jgi:hypothetical protein